MVRSPFVSVGALVLAAAACSGEGLGPLPSEPPVPPVLNPGMATVAGRVLNADGQAIAGATVSMLDLPAGDGPRVATSGADGSWQLTIPGATWAALRVEAAGFAATRSNTFSVAKGQTSTELDLIMVQPAQIEQMSAMMGGARVADYGLVALEVRSLSGACDPTGGKISIEPTQLGRVVYSRANDSEPDAGLTTMQKGARPAAWLLGVLPPGNYYRLAFAKTGCTQKSGAVEYKGRSYDGKLPIASKELSHGLLFVE